MLGAVLPAVAQDVDQGGPRQTRVRVRLVQGRYLVTARLLAVSGFDQTTSAALNRRRAEQIALAGLASHLAKGSKVELLVRGARVMRATHNGQFYRLSLEVPARDVRVVRSGEAVKPAAGEVRIRAPLESRFFTRKRDLLGLARALAGCLEDALAALEKPGRDGKRKDALARLVELEERGDEGFRRVRTKLARDRLLLLSDEVAEVNALIKLLERSWRQRLQIAARRLEQEEEP
jgi:hypothetical protein